MFNWISAALVAFPIALSTAVSSAPSNGYDLTPIEELGNKIFFDKQLSIGRNQACATCHIPEAGWVGDDTRINEAGAVYEGSIKGKFGNRKPPSSAYATLSPIFYADFGGSLLGDDEHNLASDPVFAGGNFWDGRATGWKLGNPAADQAQGPFLNPVEQALPDAACVIYRVCSGPGQGRGQGRYAGLFKRVWGPDVCAIDWPENIDHTCNQTDGVVDISPSDREKVDLAYDRVALSIAAFEGSKASNAFTSKLDAKRAGLYEFTAEEELGRQISLGKGQCSACHVGASSPEAAPPLFTNFTYANLGAPRNPENPFSVSNPDWRDPGLAGFLETVADYSIYAPANSGKHKVPTLRNVGLGSCEADENGEDESDKKHRGKKHGKDGEGCIVKAYMHNGYFKSLKSLVHFYNTRDVKSSCESFGIYDATEAVALANDCWPEPEIAENVNTDQLGNLGLTDLEEDALIAFMLTMSDGYLERDDDD